MKLTQRSPIALAILAFLGEAPMHPYQMQRFLKERGKDQVLNGRQARGPDLSRRSQSRRHL